MVIKQPKLNWKGKLSPLDIKAVKFIVIHHIEASKATIEDIHQWHLNNGWLGCGYNEYIRKDGTVYIGRGDNVGAHTESFNECSYGISLEGDYEKEQVPQEQFNSLIERCQYHINRFPKNCVIAEHGSLNNTKCPGKNVPIGKLLQSVKTNIVDEELEKALKLLQDSLIISSPDYWRSNAKKGVTCNGEYVRQLILNMQNYIYVTTTKI